MSLSQILIAGHTLISIVAIIVGVFALRNLFQAQASSASLTGFIVLAIATSATGFILPLHGVSPAVVISILALIILAAVLLSRGRLRGSRWARWVYVGGLVVSEYLLIFVGVVQAFTKVPPLKLLAPTQLEPPFAIAQGIVLVAFVVVGVLALRAFRPQGATQPSFR
ncbi:hypothetical protein LGH83_10650 [Lichenihabitans sp. PAMC28606]|uniref:hypothetical protein n=1 Tax=Lichenihabitans sp. PAMC28606 TaxID=2880932 RepID=UPI001D0AE86F|nr:hypothetical protein [Lichenihabitans sp. PAMC28606]UDL93087.1 hypothetical protein LGH83_10650 [Lichenihabitans sp. PAMC28606]